MPGAQGGRATLEPAYVLHRRPYRDTSLLLECFSRDHGRVGLIARGARRPRSRLSGVLQAFQALTLSWQGRGELATLTDAELAGPPRHLQGTRLISGLYANEILLRTTARNDPHPTLFERYVALVTALAVDAGSEGALLRIFERDLLASLGYGLSLERDRDGRPVVPQGYYGYDPGTGLYPISGERGEAVIGGRVLLGLASGEPAAAASAEARALMRRALAPYLGERPLYSRSLYRQRLRVAAETNDDTDKGDQGE
ncbi:DNA repair protein RecO [Arhodomonas sp. SL1]|uniref:DNA repair protein RecO n=1 Tax=Arhodomonas sp. SL1 TaxID=3425691 RepID=UPI003F884835